MLSEDECMKKITCLIIMLVLVLCSCAGQSDNITTAKVQNPEKTYGTVQYAIAFRQDAGTLAKVFDDTLAEMISDGSIRKICENWIDKDITECADANEMPEGNDGSLYNAKNDGGIKVGVIRLAYPMAFRDAQGWVCGIDADIIREISNRTGIEISFVNVTSKNMLAMLNSSDSENKADCIIGGVTITDTLKESVLFTRPYITTGLTLLVSDTQSADMTLEGMEGKKLGTQENTYANTYARESGIDFFEIAEYESNYDGYNRLVSHNIHALLVDEPFAYWAMQGKLDK